MDMTTYPPDARRVGALYSLPEAEFNSDIDQAGWDRLIKERLRVQIEAHCERDGYRIISDWVEKRESFPGPGGMTMLEWRTWVIAVPTKKEPQK